MIKTIADVSFVAKTEIRNARSFVTFEVYNAIYQRVFRQVEKSISNYLYVEIREKIKVDDFLFLDCVEEP